MHPILLKLGPLTIHSYGVMLMLGFMAAVAWSVKEGRRRGLSQEQIIDTGLALLVGGLIGARVMYIIAHTGEFRSPAEWFHVWEGGLAFHGSLIGGGLAMVWISKRRGIPLVPLMDTAAPGVGLGYCLGRIGCFLNGCCYGGVCDYPWAVRFHDSAFPGGLTPPSHPAQLYSSFAGLMIFLFLAWYSPRQRYAGQLILLFFFLYSIYRFAVEFFRKGVSSIVLFDGLTQAQVGSIVMALAALVLMGIVSSRAGRTKHLEREARV